jgi:hypothetical protein
VRSGDADGKGKLEERIGVGEGGGNWGMGLHGVGEEKTAVGYGMGEVVMVSSSSLSGAAWYCAALPPFLIIQRKLYMYHGNLHGDEFRCVFRIELCFLSSHFIHST